MADDPEKSGRRHVVERAVAVLGIVVISYLLGALSAAQGAWPYPLVEKGFDALAAFVHKASLGTIVDRYDSTLWRSARFEGEGVVEYDADRAFDGYTLLTSGHRMGATLVDMEGNVVHEWEKNFRDIWPDPPHVVDPAPPGFVHWARVHLFPNGDIIAAIISTDDTPSGYGLVKLDKDSNVIWAYAANTHHDFHVDDDGTIWALDGILRDLSEDPLPGLPQDQLILDEIVVKLSPDGEELRRMSVYDAMAKSKYAGEIFSVDPDDWDPLHLNQVEPAGEAFAAHHDFVDPDDLLLSFRDIDAIAVFDPKTETLDWLARGMWRHQHDLDPMDDGTLLIYDNLGAAGKPGASQILRYDPSSHAVVWSYAGRPGEPFFSWIRGSQQPLPNGDVLISDCENGRIIEVTESGDIVWEYLNPHRHVVDGHELVAIIQSAVRVPRAFARFL